MSCTPSAMRHVIIGIDHGREGGIVAFDVETGRIIRKEALPTVTVKGRVEPCIPEIIRFCRYFTLYNVTIAIEEAPDHAQSAKSLRSMAWGCGMICGALQAAGLPVTRIPVRDWQKAMLGKVPKGQTKLFAERKATLLWPNETWLATPRCYTPHDGMIDAALIASYSSTL